MLLAVEIGHWLSLAAVAGFSFIIFRDLADLSQWLVQTARANTMATFYHRHQIMAAVFSLWLAAFLSWWIADVGIGAVFWMVTGLSAFACYAGYINPRIMMRPQQHDARYYPIAKAKDHLTPDTSLIVIEAGGEARGHPDLHALRPHVVGADEGQGGETVVLTYCGLTNMGIAYRPEIEGNTVEMGVMTQLENNLVLWDRNSGEPIQQIWGRPERSGPDGPRMPQWPSFRMPLWAFEKAFPEGLIYLNPIPRFSENPLLALYDRGVQFVFSRTVKGQEVNDAPAFPTIKHFDDRLPNKTKIYGANVGEDYVAYTEDFIRGQDGPLNVEIGGRDIVVVYHEDFDSVGMYRNESGQPVSRIAFGGESDRGPLPRLETMKAQAYWVVWQNFFPQSEVNRPAKLAAHRRHG